MARKPKKISSEGGLTATAGGPSTVTAAPEAVTETASLGQAAASAGPAASGAAGVEYLGKPPRPDLGPEAHVDDRAGLPADGGAGDPQTVPTETSADEALAAADALGAGIHPDEALDAQLGEMLRVFPLLLAALRAYRAAHPGRNATGLRIAAKVDGFRRAGVAHAAAPVEHPAGAFTPEQIEQLLAEPRLVVELV